uniref:Uncharacterized protein n=1 Tax=Anopheles christyi TaxID=43041 RepID=A0A182KI93_9DIPT
MSRASSDCRRKVRFSCFAHSMHSLHSCTSIPVSASRSRNRSTSERTSLAAFALLRKLRNGRVTLIRSASSLALPSFLYVSPSSRIFCSFCRICSSSFSSTSRSRAKLVISCRFKECDCARSIIIAPAISCCNCMLALCLY